MIVGRWYVQLSVIWHWYLPLSIYNLYIYLYIFGDGDSSVVRVPDS